MPQINHLLLIGTTIIIVTALAIAEYALHRRRLARLRIRVHVNGTRGKSSVTRLIAAGLRAGGVRTCAKTTGTLPRMIMADGCEYPVFRPSGPSIIEQLRIVRAAVANDCEALVIECMALQPQLQSLSESKMIRATHGVITNVRADHLDVMGPAVEDVALALAGSVPAGARLYTTERFHLEPLRRAAADRGSRIAELGQAEMAEVTRAELDRFTYIEHPENVALALRVCSDLGIGRQMALEGMWSAAPDPGVTVDLELHFFGRRVVFVNGFAANDPESTERVWRIALERYPDLERRIAVFNCRADRPERSQQLGRAFVGWPAPQRVILMGSGTLLFARAAARAGADSAQIIVSDGSGVEEIFESIIEQAGPSALVVGMGNMGGQGLDLVRYFRNRSRLSVSIQ